MKPPKFHVGQAVVCVDGRAPSIEAAPFGVNMPKKGAIYHVREVVGRCHGAGLLLAEISNGRHLTRCGKCGKVIGTIEGAFALARFAPVELLPDEALAELLAETLEPVTA